MDHLAENQWVSTSLRTLRQFFFKDLRLAMTRGAFHLWQFEATKYKTVKCMQDLEDEIQSLKTFGLKAVNPLLEGQGIIELDIVEKQGLQSFS